MEKSLGLIVLEGSEEFGGLVNKELMSITGSAESFIIPTNECRFSNGEGKVVIGDTVRGKDIYILADVNNYSPTYTMRGITNHTSPDDHFMNVIRVISAMKNHSANVTVVMPLLYSARQHRRKGRESLDCAVILQMLENLRVNNIITFDVHDPNVQNAIPCSSFENFYPTNTVLTEFIKKEKLDLNKLIVIAPDGGAAERARFYADLLLANVGQFNKRRDLTRVVNGKNPIIAHEYIGPEVVGKTAIIVDDMIASGDSILEVAEELKKRGASKVYLISTFSLFTSGIEKFDMEYAKGIFDRVYTTNLTYIPEEYRDKEWLEIVDCSNQLATIIDRLHNGRSISDLMNGKKEMVYKIHNSSE